MSRTRSTFSKHAHILTFRLALGLATLLPLASNADACESELQDIANSAEHAPGKLDALEKLRSKCGHLGHFYYVLAKTQAQNDLVAAARETLNLGLSKTTDYEAWLRSELANTYYAAGDLDTASRMAQAVTQKFPDFFGGHALLADISLRQKRFPDAIRHAQAVIVIQPQASAYAELVLAYYATQRYQEAMAAFESARRLEGFEAYVVKNDAIVAAAFAAASLELYPKAAEILRIRLKALPESINRPQVKELVDFLKERGLWK